MTLVFLLETGPHQFQEPAAMVMTAKIRLPHANTPTPHERDSYVRDTARLTPMGTGFVTVSFVEWVTASLAFIVGTYPLDDEGTEIGKTIFPVTCIASKRGGNVWLHYKRRDLSLDGLFPMEAAKHYLSLKSKEDPAVTKKLLDKIQNFELASFLKLLKPGSVFFSTGLLMHIEGENVGYAICIEKDQLLLITETNGHTCIVNPKQCLGFLTPVRKSEIRVLSDIPDGAVMHEGFAFRNDGEGFELIGRAGSEAKRKFANRKLWRDGLLHADSRTIPGFGDFGSLAWLN